jgi:hypothetical protein
LYFSSPRISKTGGVNNPFSTGPSFCKPNSRLALAGSVQEHQSPNQPRVRRTLPAEEQTAIHPVCQIGPSFSALFAYTLVQLRRFFKYSSLRCSQAESLVLCFATQSSPEFRHLRSLQGAPEDWPNAFMVSYETMFNNNENF